MKHVDRKVYKSRCAWVGRAIHKKLCQEIRYDYKVKRYVHYSRNYQRKCLSNLPSLSDYKKDPPKMVRKKKFYFK